MFNVNAQIKQTQTGKFMDTYHLIKGSRVVIVDHDKEIKRFTYRLYVNNGETASLNHGKSKSPRGVDNFCRKHLV